MGATTNPTLHLTPQYHSPHVHHHGNDENNDGNDENNDGNDENNGWIVSPVSCASRRDAEGLGLVSVPLGMTHPVDLL